MASFISRWFYYGKLRFLGRIGYRAIITIELFCHRIYDLLFPFKPTCLDDFTVIIKTFERPKILKRLIRSIRRFYPDIKIIVADDSHNPVLIHGVKTLPLPYDSGVSAGRNAALSSVETEYTLLLDDDFVFFRKTDLHRALSLMKRYPEVDILGGKVINLPFYNSTDYRNANLFPTDAGPIKPIGSYIGKLEVLDKVPNFYIGKTAGIRKVGWDEQLTRLDHADFFTRARGVLTICYYPKLQVLHAQTIFDDEYQRHRENDAFDKGVLYRRYFGKQTKTNH